MEFSAGSLTSMVLFNLVVVSVVIMLGFGSTRIGKVFAFKFCGSLIIWVGILSAIVASGVIKNHFIPLAPLLFVTIIVSAIGLGISRVGSKFASISIWQLILFQSFRLPLEIVLHLWSETETVPISMTWTGQNFDIISGMMALGAILPNFNNKVYAWSFNIVGIGLLINVIRIVARSLPLPFNSSMEQPVLLISSLPYGMIGYVCVWAAIFGHVVLTKALLDSRQNHRS